MYFNQKLGEDSQNNDLNPVHDLSLILKSNKIIPVKMENFEKSGYLIFITIYNIFS